MIRWLKRLGLTVLIGLICLLLPIGYIELACRPAGQAVEYTSILPPEHHRAEARTLLTYPEWHIVHAYDDYAKVITTGDPHDYNYLAPIGGFWSSLCSLSKASGAHGGFPTQFKATIYTIGSSFTLELLAKAAYEETLGRIATWLRGPEPAPLDRLSARQATDYSRFLRQVPWYRWDFAADAAALTDAATDGLRDRERLLALRIEYGGKAHYAKLIAKAVAAGEPDALRLRMIVSGLGPQDIAALPDVTLVAQTDAGTVIDTPRYRALTDLLMQMAQAGAAFVEIAGNDDILFTVTSPQSDMPNALFSFERQGYGDSRHLMLVPVRQLAAQLRDLDSQGVTLEHIHDY